VCVSGLAPYNAEGLDFLAGQGEDSEWAWNIHLFKEDFDPCSKIDVEEFSAALRGEEELQKFCAPMRDGMLKADVAGIIEGMSSVLPPVDIEALLGSSEISQHMIDVIGEGLKINSDGWVDDDISFIKPWGFEISEIKVPVFLYQGSEDKMVPYTHGHWLAEHLPQEKLKKHLVQGQGHVSILVGQTDSIVDELLEIVRP
jgi:pimeloyl-ACP methyl ester carboxylesterase